MKLIFTYSLIILTSCNSIIGIKKPRYLSLQNQELFCKSHETYQCYFIDSTYNNFISKLHTNKLKNDLKQPLQFRYYEKGELKVLLVNCYLKGLGKLNWNTYKTFDSFPNSRFYYYTEPMTLSQEKMILGDKLNIPDTSTAIFVYCNNFILKQTNVLMETCASIKHLKIPIYIVNNDNYYFYLNGND